MELKVEGYTIHNLTQNELDLISMLQELAEYRGLQEKILEERALEIERDDWEREE